MIKTKDSRIKCPKCSKGLDVHSKEVDALKHGDISICLNCTVVLMYKTGSYRELNDAAILSLVREYPELKNPLRSALFTAYMAIQNRILQQN